MKVFVTGSTGFVGSHVASVLASQGADLRLLVRKTSNLSNLAGMPAPSALTTITGDLLDPESLRSGIRGCDFVFHVAADYRLWVRDPKQMYTVNVDGTCELLRIAREEGVRRVIYTSSVATMGFKTDGTIVDEQTPVSLDDMIGHYKRRSYRDERRH